VQIDSFIGFGANVVLDFVEETLICEMGVRRKQTCLEGLRKTNSISGTEGAVH
jgi:hypothetical protein